MAFTVKTYSSSIWSGNRDDFLLKFIKKKYYVYAIKKYQHSIPIYIGKGSGRRCIQHHLNPGNSAIHKFINKNPNYFVEILTESDNEDVIYQLESIYIRKFGLKIYGGNLLNFCYGGRNTAKEYYSIDSNRERSSNTHRRLSGKPIFIDGFIFEAVRQAARVLNKDRNHIKYLIKIGRAFFIDENLEENTEKYFKYTNKKLEEYQEGIRKSSLQVTTNRPVVVNNIIYGSMTEAARANGVTPPAIRKRIERGNQKNTYFLEEYVP